MPSSPETETSRADAMKDGERTRGQSAAEQEAAPPLTPEAETTADPAAELARIEDRYRRALADLDNFRKRTGREMERRVLEAKDAVLSDWLDVVDSVESAMRMDLEGPCSEGLRAVLGQIDDVLRRHGAQRTGVPGERFDPARHEAVATRPSERDQTVLEVHRSGLSRGERVVRPAQVVVGRSEPTP